MLHVEKRNSNMQQQIHLVHAW